ncbi:hypothetical protein L7F22_021937 [Adiantum nelumboides]|nr:hypothetical protein [Adiantum nelumboides]
MVPKKTGCQKEEPNGGSKRYIIFRMFGNASVRLKDLQGMLLPDRANIGKLKPYHPRNSRTQEGAQQGPNSYLGPQEEEIGKNLPIELRTKNTCHIRDFKSHLLPTIPEEQEGISKGYPDSQEKMESTQPPDIHDRNKVQVRFPGNHEGKELQGDPGNQEIIDNLGPQETKELQQCFPALGSNDRDGRNGSNGVDGWDPAFEIEVPADQWPANELAALKE